jgi:hypothetical protein
VRGGDALPHGHLARLARLRLGPRTHALGEGLVAKVDQICPRRCVAQKSASAASSVTPCWTFPLEHTGANASHVDL